MDRSKIMTDFSQGLQHLLAMYAGSVAVPLIVGGVLQLSPSQMTLLIAADLLACGVATLLQTRRFIGGIGIGLPVVLGTAFTAAATVMAIGTRYDIQTIFGAMLITGSFVVLNAPFFGRLTSLFPPVVVGSVVSLIGLSLAPLAFNNIIGFTGTPAFGDPYSFAFAFITLISIILVSRFVKGFMQTISVLLGIIVGTIAAAIFGYVDFSPVANAGWISAVQPLAFGTPKFELIPTLSLIIVAIIAQVESAGVFIIMGNICEKPTTPKDLTRGFRAEGLAIMIASLLNSFPKTTFSQNVGLIELTNVKRTSIAVYAGALMIVLSFLPKFAALVLAVPAAVLGGAMIAMFGMVAVAGIKMLLSADMEHTGNMLVLATTLIIGLGVAVAPHGAFDRLPEWLHIFTESGIVSGSIAAIVLNLFIGKKGETH